MKKCSWIILFSIAILNFTMISCNGGMKESKDQQTIDSLTTLTKNQNSHIQNMEAFITSISETMDSINTQEKELLSDGNIENKNSKNRKSIINNLIRYKETIEKQKKMIEKLENQLSSNKSEMNKKMLQITAFYKQQLEEKDRTIAALQKDLSENRANVQKLQSSVNSLLSTKQKQEETITEQKSVMTRQTEMINTCYVRIGTKKELKAAGLISTGFLKKTKLNTDLPSSEFTAMDMRKCNDILINSSNPKILTQMPASSYNFVKKDDKSCYLHISDPKTFWSISRYLVIQL